MREDSMQRSVELIDCCRPLGAATLSDGEAEATAALFRPTPETTPPSPQPPHLTASPPQAAGSNRSAPPISASSPLASTLLNVSTHVDTSRGLCTPVCTGGAPDRRSTRNQPPITVTIESSHGPQGWSPYGAPGLQPMAISGKSARR